ncbi:MAG TPA: ABC transporter substrate-binding protein [Virgibacillus sp.]|nr:ABC transporter substrate-binding protein [Virgibacillus sp.]
MRRFLLSIFVLLAMTLLVVAGCSSDSNDESDDNEENNVTESEATSGDDRTLTIAIPTDMTSQDIHDHNNTLTESIHSNMYNYLFKKDDNGEIEPELVDTYENIDDLTWEFTLHEGVKFHNGDDLTAEDVKFTLERVGNDDTLREHFHYNQIEEVEVIDDYHFKIKTYEPEPILLNRLSRIGSGILPKDYIEEHDWDHFYQNPIGSGPFKFVEWNRDSEIVFEVFEDYYEGKVEDWDELVFRVIPEDSTRVAELLTGGVDIALNVPDHEWDRIDENDGTSVESTTSQRVTMLLLRHDEGYPTSDPRVREAIDLAINNEALTEHVLGGAAVPVRSRVTPGNTGANEELYDTFLYDPDRAKELLEEAGYGDGLEITIHGPNGRYTKDRDIQEMIAGMLSEVGITVNTDLMEWSNFVELRSAHAYDDAYFIAYGNSQFDASLALDNMRSERAMELQAYKNEEFDELLAEAEVNMDLDERVEQYKRAQEIVAEDRPYIYLYAEMVNYGVSESIDFVPRADEMLFAKDIIKK